MKNSEGLTDEQIDQLIKDVEAAHKQKAEEEQAAAEAVEAAKRQAVKEAIDDIDNNGGDSFLNTFTVNGTTYFLDKEGNAVAIGYGENQVDPTLANSVLTKRNEDEATAKTAYEAAGEPDGIVTTADGRQVIRGVNGKLLYVTETDDYRTIPPLQAQFLIEYRAKGGTDIDANNAVGGNFFESVKNGWKSFTTFLTNFFSGNDGDGNDGDDSTPPPKPSFPDYGPPGTNSDDNSGPPPGHPEHNNGGNRSSAPPIVFDLDGDGVELTSLDNGIYYSIDGNGHLYKMAWVSGDDGFLAYDVDSNGVITERREIVFADYIEGAETDLEGLHYFDSNQDGVLDANDQKWANFGIWQDKDGDGITDVGEYTLLSVLGIQSITLSSDGQASTVAGNTIHGLGTYTLTDGSSQTFADVTLQTAGSGFTIDDQGTYQIRSRINTNYWVDQTEQQADITSDNTDYAGWYGQDGNDRITITHQQDVFIDGGEGNDTLTGGGGNDTIDGGSGVDHLRGGDGDDTLLFDADDVEVTGGAGVDTAILTDTSDNAVSLNLHTSAIEIVHTQGGNDTLQASGHEASVTVYAGAGDDQVTGGDQDDSLYGEAGNDTLSGGLGADQLLGGEEEDLTGGAGDDYLHGGTGNDTLRGGTGNDTYYWGLGDGDDIIVNTNSTTNGIADTNTLILGAGILPQHLTWTSHTNDLKLTVTQPDGSQQSLTFKDWLNADGSNANGLQTIVFADGQSLNVNTLNWATVSTADNDILIDSDHGNVLDGQAGDDTLHGNGGDDHLFGRADHDQLLGGMGNDVLVGGAGNDNLAGDEGNDLLHGGQGDDHLDGGAGSDTYFWGFGDGNDTIANHDTSAGRIDILQLGSGIQADDLTWSSHGEDLTLSITATDGVQQTLTLQDWLKGSDYQLNQILLANGEAVAVNQLDWHTTATEQDDIIHDASTSNRIDGRGGNDTIYGHGGDDHLYGDAGNDTLYGGAGNDHLIGGIGNDTLTGGRGNDTYYWGLGDGNDVIDNDDDSSNRTDTLVLGTGIDANNITWSRTYSDLILTVTPNNGDDQTLTLKHWFISSSHRLDQILLADNQPLDINAISWVNMTTQEDDTVHDTAASNTIDGQGGNDTIYGNGGNDHLYGGTGNDRLDGGIGNDDLAGGTGNDRLYGRGGDDHLRGGAGDDILSGGSGNDTYYWGLGDGNDRINNFDIYAGRIDTLQLGVGITAEHLSWATNGNDLIITITHNGAAQSLTLNNWFENTYQTSYQLNKILLSDGQAIALDNLQWQPTITQSNDIIHDTNTGNTIHGQGGNDDIYGHGGDDHLHGDTGDDELYGGAGNDHLRGGTGDDTLIGGTGNDTYYWGLGEGNDVITNNDSNTSRIDVLRLGEGITSDHLSWHNDGNDLILTITNNGMEQSLAFTDWFMGKQYQVDQVILANDQTIDMATIQWQPIITDASDIIRGGNADDTLSGQGGDDSIYGNHGNDSLNGDTGNDSLYGGNGNDTLNGNTDNDSLYGGNDHDHLNGGTGNDYLSGGSGNDHLAGDAGADTLIGGQGNDTYYWGLGDGNDRIENHDTSTGRIDSLQLGAGITAGDLTWTRHSNGLSVRTGGHDDLILTVINTNGDLQSLTLANWFISEDYQLNQIRLNNGHTIDLGAIEWTPANSADSDWMIDSDHDHTLYGLAGNDTIIGRGGNDHLYGNEGHDELIGGTGNDHLYGGEDHYELIGGTDNDHLYGGEDHDELIGDTGNDHLYGGEGNDRLEGGEGDDVYYWHLGDGDDRIDNHDTTTGRVDTLQLGAGIEAANILVSRTQYDLVLIVQQSDDNPQSITITNWFNGPEYQLNAIRLADGQAIDINSLNWTIPTTEQDDNVYGSDANDFIYAQSGNDTIHGDGGNDYIYGEEGDDSLYGDDGHDRIDGGAGHDHLTGGVGNDTLIGGSGNDIYHWQLGHGNDIINNYDASAGRIDTLQLGTGIDAADIVLSRFQNDLKFTINQADGASATLTISNWYGSEDYRLNKILLADGTPVDIDTLSWSNPVTAQNDTIYDRDSDNQIDGLQGDDTIYGYGGNDTLYGNEGKDRLEGGHGNDTLDGGAGIDTLVGGAGSDIYYWEPGDGNDIIINNDTSADRIDTLQLGPGIEADDIVLSRFQNDLKFTINQADGTSETLTLNDWFRGENYRLNKILLADNSPVDFDTLPWNNAITAQSDTIYDKDSGNRINGLQGNDTIYGYGGNDHLLGNEDNDRLYGGYGNDILEGGDGNDDIYGGDDSSYHYRNNYGHDTLDGGDGDDRLYGAAGNDELIGGIGNDTLQGGYGNDKLTGGTGNDALYGGRGSDTYDWKLGDGDDTITEDYRYLHSNTIVIEAEGVTASDLLWSSEGYDLLLTINHNSTTETLTFKNWLQYGFFKSQVLTLNGQPIDFNNITWSYSLSTGDDVIYDHSANSTIAGQAGNDTIYGDVGNDTLYGGADNDTLAGGDGNDTLDGGTGNDVLHSGHGNDTLLGGDGNDTLYGRASYNR